MIFRLISNTAIVCTLDTLVALFAGFMIIPAVFATGIAPGMGGGFGFATLAGVFMAIPGGQLIGTVFYFLLFFAAITSSTCSAHPLSSLSLVLCIHFLRHT